MVEISDQNVQDNLNYNSKFENKDNNYLSFSSSSYTDLSWKKLNIKQDYQINKMVLENFQYSYAEINKQDFFNEYRLESKFIFRLLSSSLALVSLVKTIYHFSMMILYGKILSQNNELNREKAKLNQFYGFRDLEEIYGRLMSIINEKLGEYHLQKSLFHKDCYSLYAKAIKEFELNFVGFGGDGSLKFEKNKWLLKKSISVIDKIFQFLPSNLRIEGSFFANHTKLLTKIPENLDVQACVQLRDCSHLSSISKGLKVGDYMFIDDCPELESLTDDLSVGTFLHIKNCPKLLSLSNRLIAKEFISIADCVNLTSIPNNVSTPKLYITNCPNLKELPSELMVDEIYLGQCDETTPLLQWILDNRFSTQKPITVHLQLRDNCENFRELLEKIKRDDIIFEIKVIDPIQVESLAEESAE